MRIKHYIFTFITVVIATALTISVIAFIVREDTPKEEPEPIETIVAPTKYDIVLECQRLAAGATNEDWGYASCLKELENSVDNLRIRLN